MMRLRLCFVLVFGALLLPVFAQYLQDSFLHVHIGPLELQLEIPGNFAANQGASNDINDHIIRRYHTALHAAREQVVTSPSPDNPFWATFAHVVNESRPFPSAVAIENYLSTLLTYLECTKPALETRPSRVAFEFQTSNILMQTSAILNMQAGQQYADGNAEVSLDYLRRAVAEHGQFARGDGVGAIVAGNTAGLAILLYFHCVGLPKPTGLCGHPWMLLYEAHSAAAHALHADPSSPRVLYYSGLVNEELGYREAATSHFTRCIELSYAHTLDVATECYNRLLVLSGRRVDTILTHTQPSFLLTIGDSRDPAAVALALKTHRIQDFHTTQVFGGLVARKCEKHDGVAPAVIDIGAVVGYSSIQAAVSGCAVLAIEANVGDCHLIRASAALNGFEDRVTVLHANVGVDGSVASLRSVLRDSNPLLQSTSQLDCSIDCCDTTGNDTPAPPVIRLDDVLVSLRGHGIRGCTPVSCAVLTAPIDIAAVKLNLGGCEIPALETLLPALPDATAPTDAPVIAQVPDVFVNVCPGLWQRCSTELHHAANILWALVAAGMEVRIYHATRAAVAIRADLEQLAGLQGGHLVLTMPSAHAMAAFFATFAHDPSACMHLWFAPKELT